MNLKIIRIDHLPLLVLFSPEHDVIHQQNGLCCFSCIIDFGQDFSVQLQFILTHLSILFDLHGLI